MLRVAAEADFGKNRTIFENQEVDIAEASDKATSDSAEPQLDDSPNPRLRLLPSLMAELSKDR